MYRTVVYAYLPLSILVPVLLFNEVALITGWFNYANSAVLALVYVLQGIVLIGTVYFIVLLVVATSVVHQIKTWQAAVTVVVPVVLLTAGAMALLFSVN